MNEKDLGHNLKTKERKRFGLQFQIAFQKLGESSFSCFSVWFESSVRNPGSSQKQNHKIPLDHLSPPTNHRSFTNIIVHYI